jgi:hypothetical protein
LPKYIKCIARGFFLCLWIHVVYRLTEELQFATAVAQKICQIFLLGWLLCHYYISCFQWLIIIPALNVLNRMKMSLKCQNLFHQHPQFQRSRREFWLISIIIPLGIWKRNLGKKWKIFCVTEITWGVSKVCIPTLRVSFLHTNK